MPKLDRLLKAKQAQASSIPQNLQLILSRSRSDPVIFTNHLLGMPLHPGQVAYLRETTARGNKKNILVPANRWGKSVTIACLQLWYLYHKFGVPSGNSAPWRRAEYRTANIAPHSALTEPVFKIIHQIMTSSFPIRLPDGSLVSNSCLIEWFYLPDRTINTPPYKQFFANNSYIEHRSLGADKGDSLQGKPYGIITYDEGGRSMHLQQEVDGNIMPRLFDWGGPFHLLSTPDQNSPSILYHYEMYEDGLKGLNDTYTREGALTDNTFFSKQQIAKQYKAYADNPLGPQVLEGKFLFGGDNLFPADQIKAAYDDSLNNGVRYQEDHNYVIGIDTAIGADEMVYSVVDITKKPYRLVRQIAAKGNSKSPQQHMNDLIDLVFSYYKHNSVTILLETWNGESARFYEDLPYELQAITQCYGSWQPSKLRTENKNRAANRTRDIKKADILLALQKLLAAGEIKLPHSNHELAKQLSIYKEDDARIPTDRVISLALAAYLAVKQETSHAAPTWQTVEW